MTVNASLGTAAIGSPKSRVLVVDDEASLLRAYARTLTAAGYDVESAADGAAAAALLTGAPFDAIVSDIAMPGMNGLELLRRVREHDLDLPVLLATGTPALETAVQALEFGALRYLVKPFSMETLVSAVADAVRLHRLARMKRDAIALLGEANKLSGDRAGLEASFSRALASMWMAYQPIVAWHTKTVFGFEALVRPNEPSLPHPGALFDAAERLGALEPLGGAIRARVGACVSDLPASAALFVNLHTRDLLDPTLFLESAPLTRIARRVVLEITERASLAEIPDVRARINALKAMGFRVAVDDLGAGYAGLTSFALLEPDIVKLDMSLVRDVHKQPLKRKLVQSMTTLCKDLGMLVVAEGVETTDERDVLVACGCDLLQGYLFAKPGKGFPAVTW